VINVVQIVGDFTLEQFKGKYVILFFYPKDFIFACPTELFASQEKIAGFESRGVQLIGVSMDTEQSHWAWLQMEKNKVGIRGVTYPVLADTNKTISPNYDVLVGEWDYNEEGNGNMTATDEMIAYRGLFLIDPNGTVRHQLVKDLPLGRNVDEALRMVDDFQYFEEKGDVCPANWIKAKDAMKASHEGVAGYLSAN
jgi:peroxiredoxin (alkyl hydroperoxide reductase subunit C)